MNRTVFQVRYFAAAVVVAATFLLVTVRAGDARHAAAEAAPGAFDAKAAATEDGISVYFSPKGGCTEAIVDQIGKAKKELRVQGYSFTSVPIAKAVLDAKGRGVNVSVVLDGSNRSSKYSSATFLFNHDVPVFIDAKHKIAHNKIILVDDRVIITGSFNFSTAAEESNAENLLVIHGKAALMQAYTANFDEHLKHAEKYEGLMKDSSDE